MAEHSAFLLQTFSLSLSPITRGSINKRLTAGTQQPNTFIYFWGNGLIDFFLVPERCCDIGA